jgi:Ser/Thr protein kinase RdoA (MazF antagonist)
VARERINLLPVLKRYKARVNRIAVHGDHFLLETDRGIKELRIWPRVDVMRWSFAWREQLARLGYTNVERFIRTRDARPFVVLGQKGFTLTDHLAEVEAYLPTAEHAEHCGRVVANMHAAQQANHLSFAADLLKREQAHAIAEAKRARELQQQFLSHHFHPSEQDKWVASQFPPLLERMERSAEMLAASRVDPELLFVSHRKLSSKNWGLIDDKLFLRGFYQPVLSVQLRDVASFLRELGAESGDPQRIAAFLDGYEALKPLSYGEYALLLAFMVYPREAWKSIHDYVNLRLTGQETESAAEVHAALQKEKRVDRLIRQIALRAERARSGTANEPI